jgi:hypothetical protein
VIFKLLVAVAACEDCFCTTATTAKTIAAKAQITSSRRTKLSLFDRFNMIRRFGFAEGVPACVT